MAASTILPPTIVQRPLSELSAMMGKRYAFELYEACQGISNDSVISKVQRKSFGIEKTFFDAIDHVVEVGNEIHDLLAKYNERLKDLDPFHLHEREISHLVIKLRFSNFKTYTRAVFIEPAHSSAIIRDKCLDQDACEKIAALFDEVIKQFQLSIRLIGLGVRLREKGQEQLTLI